jgi:hypothetical protein
MLLDADYFNKNCLQYVKVNHHFLNKIIFFSSTKVVDYIIMNPTTENFFPFRHTFRVTLPLKMQQWTAQSATDLLKSHIHMVMNISTSMQAGTKGAMCPTKGFRCEAHTGMSLCLLILRRCWYLSVPFFFVFSFLYRNVMESYQERESAHFAGPPHGIQRSRETRPSAVFRVAAVLEPQWHARNTREYFKRRWNCSRNMGCGLSVSYNSIQCFIHLFVCLPNNLNANYFINKHEHVWKQTHTHKQRQRQKRQLTQ